MAVDRAEASGERGDACTVERQPLQLEDAERRTCHGAAPSKSFADWHFVVDHANCWTTQGGGVIRRAEGRCKMPNQRKEGKTRIAVWLTKEQRDAIRRAISDGVAKDMSDFIIQAIAQEQRRQGGENAQS